MPPSAPPPPSIQQPPSGASATTMATTASTLRRRATPFGYRLRRVVGTFFRRLLRRPSGVPEGPNLLPLLIRVLACFSKLDGKILEEEIDSSLGFLRHDYPETVYSELRRQFRQALNEQPDLDAMAAKLNTQLTADRKILLGIQLWDLIGRAGQRSEQVVAFYKFMAGVGMTSQAIDIVYQLNSSEASDPSPFQRGNSPLESLVFGSEKSSDVIFKELPAADRLFVYRYGDLILIKNLCTVPVVVNGRPLGRSALGRLYEGQRVVVGERVLAYQELVAYFNAKKNVAIPQVYLAINKDDEVSFERARTRDSVLEVRFGLRVQVTALRRVNARLNGVELRSGAKVEATLEDKIVFHNDSELPLIDLRRRARALGGRFQLLASKSEYLVSNNPGRLDADDILLSPGTGGDVLLKISCDYEKRVGVLEVLQASRAIMVGDTPVRNTARLADGDVIRIDVGQVLRCNFSERIIEEERNVIRVLEVRDLKHSFRKGGEKAIDNISFNATRGEMICVMGPSGSGKSTLLRTIAGQNSPTGGEVILNGRSLYKNLDELRGYISYIPQEDAFDEQLTIEENLTLAAALRSPHLSSRERARRIDGKLIELGLNERRGSLVGSAIKKTLSGGERKRLNIGLDMIGGADIYLFDEPTSGLSSKDSEHVIDIVKGMSHNKIVLVTIHQPSSKIFQMFNKVVLLDKGGRLVFFGTPTEALSYFAHAENEQQHGVDVEGCAACGSTRPEFIFDVLETPLRDMSGDIIYEENARGQLVPARRFSPEFWRDKYESYRLLQDVRQVPLKRESSATTQAPLGPHPARQRWWTGVRWRDEWTQFRTLLHRAFFSKLRNRVNVVTTLVEAPVLAALIAVVLRYNEAGTYDFAGSYHIPIYLFLTVTVAMFLGLTNSADDIIRDRVVLQRERNLRIRLPYYILAKVSTLCLFALIQCVLFLLIGNYILQVRGMFWIYLGYTALTAFCGVSLGLLISSLVADAKTAVNIVPLILIPQIIMGGALIKYEDMNRNLDFVYTVHRWFAHHPDGAEKDGKEPEERNKLQVPLICQFMPMRWSYEAMVVATAKLNPLTGRQERIQAEINALRDRQENLEDNGQSLSDAERDRLDGLKDLLALLSSLEADSAANVDKDLRLIDVSERQQPPGAMALPEHGSGVTAEQLYVNQKITDLVSKAEMQQEDYRNGERKQPELNVFFGAYRYIRHRRFSVHLVNSCVLVAFSVLVLGLLHASLHRELER